MIAALTTVARTVLYLVAFFWVLGGFPIISYLDRFRFRSRRMKDRVLATIFLLWMVIGLLGFRYLVPVTINPFCDRSGCSWSDQDE